MTFPRRQSGRRAIPGEDRLPAGGDAGLLHWAGRAVSPWLRTVVLIAGGVLVLRALSGRDAPLVRPPYEPYEPYEGR